MLGEAFLRLLRGATGARHRTVPQYCAAVVANNWGSHFEERLQDLEQCTADLELIRIHKIRDERDDLVEAVETEV